MSKEELQVAFANIKAKVREFSDTYNVSKDLSVHMLDFLMDSESNTLTCQIRYFLASVYNELQQNDKELKQFKSDTMSLFNLSKSTFYRLKNVKYTPLSSEIDVVLSKGFL